jgi:hypothetical protein
VRRREFLVPLLRHILEVFHLWRRFGLVHASWTDAHQLLLGILIRTHFVYSRLTRKRHCICHHAQLNLVINALLDHLLPISHHHSQRWVWRLPLSLCIQKVFPHLRLLHSLYFIYTWPITWEIRRAWELLCNRANFSPFRDFECNRLIHTRLDDYALLDWLGWLFHNFLLLGLRLTNRIRLWEDRVVDTVVSQSDQ